MSLKLSISVIIVGLLSLFENLTKGELEGDKITWVNSHTEDKIHRAIIHEWTEILQEILKDTDRRVDLGSEAIEKIYPHSDVNRKVDMKMETIRNLRTQINYLQFGVSKNPVITEGVGIVQASDFFFYIPFDWKSRSMDLKQVRYATSLAQVKIKTTEPTNVGSEFQKQWGKLKLKSIPLKYIQVDVNSKNYKKGFLVLFQAGLEFKANIWPFGKVQYGFAACVTMNEDEAKNGEEQLFVLGFGQLSAEMEIAIEAMKAYLRDPDSFGEVVSLPNFYSGEEGNGLKKFGEAELKLPKKFKSYQLLRAWKLSKVYVGMFKLMQGVGVIGTPYVVMRVDVDKMDRGVIADEDFVVGTHYKRQYSAMVNLVESLQPLELREHITPYLLPDDPVAKLLCIADYTARKIAFKDLDNVRDPKDEDDISDADTKDRTPYINHSIEVANIVVETVNDVDLLAAIFLSDFLNFQDATVYANRMEDIRKELNDYDTNKLDSLMTKRYSRDAEAPNLVTKTILSDTKQLEFFTGLIQPQFSLEGLPLQNTLIKGIQARREAEQTKRKVQENFPDFNVSFKEAMEIKSKRYGIYTLAETTPRLDKFKKPESNSKTYQFVVETDMGKYFDTPIVAGTNVKGELYATVSELLRTQPNVLEHIITDNYKHAAAFEYAYTTWLTGQSEAKKKELQKPTDAKIKLGLKKLLECLRLAANKHSHIYQRRKDADKLPYINHVIGVARILVVVAGVVDYKIIFAAILHDIIENSDVTEGMLAKLFGHEVATIVKQVSDVTTAGNEVTTAEQRKAEQIAKALNQIPGAVLVKMADIIYNLGDQLFQCPFDFGEKKRQANFHRIETEHLPSFKKNRERNKDDWEKRPDLANAFEILSNMISSIIMVFRESQMKAAVF